MNLANTYIMNQIEKTEGKLVDGICSTSAQLLVCFGSIQQLIDHQVMLH